MIHGCPRVVYHNHVDVNQSPTWVPTLREAVEEFVSAVRDEARTLSRMAEQFTSDSLQTINDAAAKAEQSAMASSDMAVEARSAAEEARRATESMRQVIAESGEHALTEARAAIDQATGQAARLREVEERMRQDMATQTAEVQESSERLKLDITRRFDEMVARLDQASGANRDASAAALAASAAANDGVERLKQSVSTAEAAVAAAQRASEQAEAASEAARQSAVQAEDTALQNPFVVEAGALLERLEDDYSLLTRLVQEIHTRISSLTSVSIDPDSSYYGGSDAEYGDEDEDEEVEAYASDPQQASGSQAPAYDLAPGSLDASSDDPEAQVQAATLAGPFQVSLLPVPDMDRVMELDEALAHVAGIGNVMLADYAGEEVTFRLEAEEPMSPLTLAQRLGETAGIQTTLIEASDGMIRLQID